MKKRTDQKKEALLGPLGLPQDVVRGELLLTFIGNRTIRIENYRSILIYTDTHIRIQAKRYKLSVSGRNLKIRYYDKDEMEIGGQLESVTFEQAGR